MNRGLPVLEKSPAAGQKDRGPGDENVFSSEELSGRRTLKLMKNVTPYRHRRL